MKNEIQPYLVSSPTIDYDHPLVADFARKHAACSREPREQAVKLYLAVRDTIRYDPYSARSFG